MRLANLAACADTFSVLIDGLHFKPRRGDEFSKRKATLALRQPPELPHRLPGEREEGEGSCGEGSCRNGEITANADSRNRQTPTATPADPGVLLKEIVVEAARESLVIGQV
jgi:hypothetical protein